ncbi:MAG TPA: hypothetical protein VJ436_03980, partial [Anaerolineales bacterium]|nr:hypothetical protein [Anaerolineales bacterium]
MNTPQPPKTTLLAAWIVVLLTSALPKVILQEIFGQTVSQDLQAVISLSVIFIALLATLIWQPLRGLRPFLALFLVLVSSQWLVYNRIGQLSFYRTWLRNTSFNVYMLAELSLNLIVTLIMIAALVLMNKKRADFYLVRGDTAAPVEPIRWLGVKQG